MLDFFLRVVLRRAKVLKLQAKSVMLKSYYKSVFHTIVLIRCFKILVEDCIDLNINDVFIHLVYFFLSMYMHLFISSFSSVYMCFFIIDHQYVEII